MNIFAKEHVCGVLACPAPDDKRLIGRAELKLIFMIVSMEYTPIVLRILFLINV